MNPGIALCLQCEQVVRGYVNFLVSKRKVFAAHVYRVYCVIGLIDKAAL